MYLLKTDHALVSPWWSHFVHRALFGAYLKMVHPLGDIRDLNLLVSNQEILYVSIYKSMYTLWHPGWCLFVWFDSLRPINNLSVIKGRVFLGWTSTKLGLMCLAQGHNAVNLVRLEPAALRFRVKHSTTEPLRSRKSRMRPIWPRNYNLSKLSIVPQGDVSYQISKLWGILFSGKNIFNVFSK